MKRPSRIYCGNNALANQLQENGGDENFGRPSQCFRRGFARGFKQEIPDLGAFMEQWGGPYAPHVEQRLYFGDKSDIPAAYVARATLPQAVSPLPQQQRMWPKHPGDPGRRRRKQNCQCR